MTAIRRGDRFRASRAPVTSLFLVGAFAWTALPAMAADGEKIAAGRLLVETHCSSCHATGDTGESPLAAAPKFRDLHVLYDVELLGESLVEGIATAHPDMPQFAFGPAQAEAIVAYLKSLER